MPTQHLRRRPLPRTRDPRAPSRIDAFLRPYVSEPSLWPVTLVLLAHGVLGVAVALLDGVRDGAGFGLGALLGIGIALAACLVRDLRRRRLGLTTAALLMSVGLGALCAWLADRHGLY